MPENLLEKVFTSWFEFTDHAEESQIDLETRVNGESTLPGGLGSFINDFWQHRPTRLFSMLENYRPDSPQTWFTFLDHEIKRLSIVLARNYHARSQLEHLEKLACKHDESDLQKLLQRYFKGVENSGFASQKSRPAVPLIIASSNPHHPKVIFDRFSNDFSLFMRLPEDNPAISAHRRICELFMRHTAGQKLSLPLLPLMCFPFPGFAIEGNSFELGLWVSLWLADHNWPQTGNLCCTGTISTVDGRIGEVTHLDEKLAAALSMGFSTCLVPAAGFSSSGFYADSRVVALNDVDELNSWLLQNSGNARQIRRVVGWLQSDRRTPDPKDFAAFFADSPALESEPATNWKNLLRHRPPAERLSRLKHLVREFYNDARDDTLKMLALLPGSLRYACLPWLIQSLLKSKPTAAEQLYLTFSRRCAESSPEIYHASRFLFDKSYLLLLTQPDFAVIHHRFPLLLWLFFREPSEMLFAFSLINQLNRVEQSLLHDLVALLNQHARSYTANTGNHRTDARIMQKLLKKIDNEARFRPGPLLTIRKRLLYLWQAQENFLRGENASAATCCRQLLNLHLFYLTRKASPGLDLVDAFAQGACDTFALKKMNAIPALHDLLQAIRGAKSQPDGSCQPKPHAQNPVKILKIALQGKAPDMLWAPQPGIACLRAVMTGDWPSLNFFGLIRKFTSNSYHTPATELREACLAYWAGAINSHYIGTSEKLVKSGAYRHAGNLRLPFLVGWLRQKSVSDKSPGCTICQELVLKAKFPVESLVWLLLLPRKCGSCMTPWLTSLLSQIRPPAESDELRRKSDIHISMLQALVEPDSQTKSASLWLSSLAQCEHNPQKARRTVQALAPLHYLLSGDSGQAWHHVRKSRHLVNNSEFALAFLLRFTRLGKPDFRVQPVPELSQSVEKQLLDSLTLAYYRIFKPGLFERYILSETDDLANLQVISR